MVCPSHGWSSNRLWTRHCSTPAGYFGSYKRASSWFWSVQPLSWTFGGSHGDNIMAFPVLKRPWSCQTKILDQHVRYMASHFSKGTYSSTWFAAQSWSSLLNSSSFSEIYRPSQQTDSRKMPAKVQQLPFRHQCSGTRPLQSPPMGPREGPRPA